MVEREPEDAAWVRRMALGDQDALARLYDMHAPLLRGVAVRVLGSVAEAEDLVHDVFLEAWRRASSYDPSRCSVRTWLLVRTRSRCIDRIRALKVRRDVLVDRPPQPQPLWGADRMMAYADASRLGDAVDQLPAEQREVLLLLYVHGLSSSEVATKLGAPIGTVKSRVRLAMRQLRASLMEGSA